MSYRSPLEARIAKKTTRAIIDFTLIEDGDRVMVGLSGGKDSWALMQTLDQLRRRAPISFSLIAVNVDSGYKDFKHDVIAKTCEERGWEYRIEHTAIGNVMDDLLDANAPRLEPRDRRALAVGEHERDPRGERAIRDPVEEVQDRAAASGDERDEIKHRGGAQAAASRAAAREIPAS